MGGREKFLGGRKGRGEGRRERLNRESRGGVGERERKEGRREKEGERRG